MTKKATKRLSDSVWTLEYVDNNNNTITIIKLSKDPNGHQSKLPIFEFVELSDNIEVIIEDNTYEAGVSWPNLASFIDSLKEFNKDVLIFKGLNQTV